MLALSIRQPWAWLVVAGHKTIENRTRKTNIRGEVLIHASKTKPTEQEMAMLRRICKALRVACPMTMHYGGIIGSVEIVDCITHSDSEWFTGPYGYVLKNARSIKFKEATGNTGFFEVNYKLV